MSDDKLPPGSAPEPKRSGTPREDKIAFGVILSAICLAGLGLIWLLAKALSLIGIALGATEAGVGVRDAFLVSIPIAFAVIILFALVAGDGLVGELGAMLIGFFVMLIFFTGAIAIIL